MDILLEAYSSLNLGDDLFIKIICERYPDHNFVLLADSRYRKIYEKLDNLSVFPMYRGIERIFRYYSKKKIKIANELDATVNIGGSIFIEPETQSQVKIEDYNRLINASSNFFIIGSNFGPYKNDTFYHDYKDMFKAVNDVCFRDNFSYELFSELPNVRYAPDVVFSLDVDNIRIKNSGNYYVLSVINLENRTGLKEYTTIYEETIANLSRKLMENGYKVVLMSFCEAEGDEIAIERIKSKLDSNRAITYFYRGDLDEALSLIKASSGVIATRFHSMILAWLFNLPVVPLIYSDKTLNVIKDVGFDNYHTHISQMDKFDYDLALEKLSENIYFDINDSITASNHQFKALDLFLD